MTSKLKFMGMIALTGMVLLGSTTGGSAMQSKKSTKKPAAGAPSKAAIEAGRKMYDASGCGACHAVGDKGGKTGPELTHVGKTWKADKLASLIRDPKTANPDAKMPAYPADKISDKEMKSLLTYLGSLK